MSDRWRQLERDIAGLEINADQLPRTAFMLARLASIVDVIETDDDVVTPVGLDEAYKAVMAFKLACDGQRSG